MAAALIDGVGCPAGGLLPEWPVSVMLPGPAFLASGGIVTQMQRPPAAIYADGDAGPDPYYSLDANIIIANAPDPVFVSDPEGKILQANDAASELLGFRPDELVEQSLSRFISAEEERECSAARRVVVERGVTRTARLNPSSASGEGM